MSKILFTDIDGTLLNSSGIVSTENREAIQKCIAEGNRVVLTSGRSVRGQKVVLDQLGATDGMYMIGFQGGLLYDFNADKLMYEKFLDGEVASKILKMAEDMGIHAHAYAAEGIYTPGYTDTFRKYINITKENGIEFSDPSEISDKKIYKVLAASFEDETILYKFKEKIEKCDFISKIDLIFSAATLFEIIPKGVSKGGGLRKMTEYLGASLKDTVSVGDERNDISMIEAACTGCAMQNGRPELKEKADYITERDNNHSGVAEVIKKFILR
jgi:Cof subfamily protein (haloacid dehalogenase superfamily)